MNLPLIPQDKANHAIYGALAFAIGAAASHLLPIVPAVIAGLVVCAVVAVGKEGLDWWLNRRAVAAGEAPPHGVEVRDALATLAGGVVVAAATLLA